ncbi:uncharacterized protein V1513DRAFT_437204 [Lipomyces chichibuensis]|uniref:uncharacterized protein n=1 Tax=Lipomyces chichibuensis TaxID=1546026 RepID=UPI0033434E4D
MEVSTLVRSLHPDAADADISLALDGIEQHAIKMATKTNNVKELVYVSEKVGTEIDKSGARAIALVNAFPPVDETQMTKATDIVHASVEADSGFPRGVEDGKEDYDGLATYMSTLSSSAPLKRKRAQTLFEIVKHRRRTGKSPCKPNDANDPTGGRDSLKRKRGFEFGGTLPQDQPLKRRAGVEQWLIAHLRGNADTNKLSRTARISRVMCSQRKNAAARPQSAGSDADDESSEYGMSIGSVRSTSVDREDGALLVGKLSAGRIIAIPVFDSTQTKLDTTNIAELVASMPALNTARDVFASRMTAIGRNERAKGDAPDITKKGRKLADMLLSMDIITTPELTTTSSSSGTESGSSPDMSPGSKGVEHGAIKDVELEVVQVSPPPPYTSPQQDADYLKIDIVRGVNDDAIVRDSTLKVLTRIPKTQHIDGEHLFSPSPPPRSSPSAIIGKDMSPLTESFQRLQLNGTTFDAEGDEELLEYTDTEATLSFASRFKPATVYITKEAERKSAILF